MRVLHCKMPGRAHLRGRHEKHKRNDLEHRDHNTRDEDHYSERPGTGSKEIDDAAQDRVFLTTEQKARAHGR